MAAPDTVLHLVARFEQQREQYRASSYNETTLRRDFLDPFFRALGWDMDNTQGYAEAYREVVHEYQLPGVGPATHPDYCFRVGGKDIFFVEAKKPSVVLKDDIAAAYQVRRYAWSAKLPLAILTDFEEFAVYDCRRKPTQTDAATLGRVLYLTYREYGERWDELAGRFSRDAVLKGAFDRYAESTTAKRGTADVDDDFLATLEGWRELLARNLALRNPTLTVRQLNHAVQTTIDRIVFLRIAEERGLEVYGRLQGLLNGAQTYGRLSEQFREADDRYNSGLFHFRGEKGRATEPDGWTLTLAIDDRVLKDIVGGLYYPDCPYAFAVLPADILGQIYERFPGKVIRLTPGHQARVEDKPEVKKAGGVYYTPTYIVDYIVRHTVGPLLEGKQPGDVRALRILDPACGSGSFLLGAYQYLLDWYLARYQERPTQHARGKAPALVETPGGWRLTVAERKRILTDHIHGVDIDAQAVEVTKLSLLLKVLEGETEAQLKLFHERALPDLDRNIQCGNSLIGPEFYAGHLPGTLDEETEYRINVFDWRAGFPAAMAAGGFDAVIGNPPYIRIQTLKEWAPVEVEEYKRRYAAARQGNYDIYVVFVEKGLSLLNATGRLGFILPHKFFNAKYGEPLRALLAEGRHLAEIVHFGDQQVFEGATTYTCLLMLGKAPAAEFRFTQVRDLVAWRRTIKQADAVLPAAAAAAASWTFAVGAMPALITRMCTAPTRLEHAAHTFVGTQTSADDVFVLDDVVASESTVTGSCRLTGARVQIERALTKPFLRGKDVRRYRTPAASSALICPYAIASDSFALMSESHLKANHPLAYAYLSQHRRVLEARERGRFRGSGWYAFAYPKSMTLFQYRKIIVPDYNNVASYTLDEAGHFYKTGYGILLRATRRETAEYVLGLLNSTLLFRLLSGWATMLRGGYVRFWTQYIEKLPIRPIDFTNPADVARHDRMVAMVEQMLALHRQLDAPGTPHEKQALQRRIDALDQQIDALVYELYELTDREIAVVEGHADELADRGEGTSSAPQPL